MRTFTLHRKAHSPEPVDASAAPCQQCGRPRPLLAIEHEDEFCSTVCARRAFGVPESVPADPAEAGRR